MDDLQRSPIFLEKLGPDMWLLTIDGDQVPFRTAGGSYMATDMAYEMLASRGFAHLIIQHRAADGRYYAIPQSV